MADNKKGGLGGALDNMGQSESPDLAQSFEPVVKIINDVVVATATIKEIESQLTKEKSEQLKALADSIEKQKALARDQSKSTQEKAEADKKAKALMVELENQREDIKKKSEKAAEARQSQMMKQLSAEEKESVRQKQSLEAKGQIANLKQQRSELIAMGDAIGARKLQDEIKNLEKVADLTGKKYAKIAEENAAEKLAYEQHLISLEQAGQKEINDMLEQAGMDETGRLKAHYTEAEKREKELNDLRAKWQKEKTAAEEAAQEALQKNDEEYQKKKLAELIEEGYDEDSANERIAKEAADAEEKAKKAKEQFSETSKKLSNEEEQEKADKKQKDAAEKTESAINGRLDNFTKYQATVNARLQGSTEKYQLALLNIQARLSFSPFVKQQDVIENIKKLSDEGIAYNLEQRAFLQTISDKIANTFNAADGTLLRLIRLQQADTTAARLGMEAMLTKYLNSMFEDTSYLSGAHDPVNNNLIDAFSQMSKDVAAEFELTVHRWLGALGSLGVSDNTLTTIAQGINYLATGDVTSLSSNESLQTLIAMTTSRMSKSYSDILVVGLDVDTTKDLLREMVEYLKELAESDNMVVKNQFSKIFGMSMSDLTAISNITDAEIKKISSYTTSYDSMLDETDLQLKLMPLRMSMSEMISNVVENFYDQIAYSISVNPVSRITWELNKMVDTETGGINIPFINAMGFGLDLNTDLNSLTNLGMVGLSTLAQIPKLLASVVNGGGLFLDAWGIRETTRRGSGLQVTLDGIIESLSSSVAYKSSASSKDQEEGTLSDAAEKAEETGNVINKDYKQDHDFDDLFSTLFLDDQKPVMINYKSDSDFGQIMQKVGQAYESSVNAFRVLASLNPDTTIMAGVFNAPTQSNLNVTVSNPESIAKLMRSSGDEDEEKNAMPVKIVGDLSRTVKESIKKAITDAMSEAEKNDVSLISTLTGESDKATVTAADGKTTMSSVNLEDTLLYRIILQALGYFSSEIDGHAINVVAGQGVGTADPWEKSGNWNRWNYNKPQ